jgi:hypothetical protein
MNMTYSIAATKALRGAEVCAEAGGRGGLASARRGPQRKKEVKRGIRIKKTEHRHFGSYRMIIHLIDTRFLFIPFLGMHALATSNGLRSRQSRHLPGEIHSSACL